MMMTMRMRMLIMVPSWTYLSSPFSNDDDDDENEDDNVWWMKVLETLPSWMYRLSPFSSSEAWARKSPARETYKRWFWRWLDDDDDDNYDDTTHHNNIFYNWKNSLYQTQSPQYWRSSPASYKVFMIHLWKVPIIIFPYNSVIDGFDFFGLLWWWWCQWQWWWLHHRPLCFENFCPASFYVRCVHQDLIIFWLLPTDLKIFQTSASGGAASSFVEEKVFDYKSFDTDLLHNGVEIKITSFLQRYFWRCVPNYLSLRR